MATLTIKRGDRKPDKINGIRAIRYALGLDFRTAKNIMNSVDRKPVTLEMRVLESRTVSWLRESGYEVVVEDGAEERNAVVHLAITVLKADLSNSLELGEDYVTVPRGALEDLIGWAEEHLIGE